MAKSSLVDYKRARGPLPGTNRLWPLYGAGLENMGKEGKPIEVPLPAYGPDELLVRHEAVGLCFSDIKVIRLGEDHPRIYRTMRDDPVVLGHEICLAVVAVGENLRAQYQVGDRFTVQADIHVDGVGYAYGYEIQGGLSEYNVIDQRVLNGDDGNYLIPVQATTGYAESALTEPWACVIAAYQLKYRTALKPGGTTWVIGAAPDEHKAYTIGAGFDEASHPDRLLLSRVPSAFAADLKARAERLGVAVLEVEDIANPPVEQVDDIVVLGALPEVIELVSPRLADFGVVAVIAESAPARNVDIDMGRVHYNRWLYVGGTAADVARAYSAVPVRSTLKPGGRALFVGAGGPMGRMHVQRAIQLANGPATVVCTEVSAVRLDDLRVTFAAEAEAKGVDFVCLDPTSQEAYAAAMAPYAEYGFDDIIVLAPVPAVIAEAASYLAPAGVMNVFAGVARGTKVGLELADLYLKDVRWIGHSASTIDDLRLMLHQAETGELSPNRAVAAIGSLEAARDGMQAMIDAVYPGKVVIYPHIREMPLTALPDLEETLPTVYAKLKGGREWTVEAEEEFLSLMLK